MVDSSRAAATRPTRPTGSMTCIAAGVVICFCKVGSVIAARVCWAAVASTRWAGLCSST